MLTAFSNVSFLMPQDFVSLMVWLYYTSHNVYYVK